MPHRMPHGDDRVDGQNSRQDYGERGFVLLRQHHDTHTLRAKKKYSTSLGE